MMNTSKQPQALVDSERQRPTSIDLPPCSIPASSTFVFTSSRTTHLPAKPPTPAASEPVLSQPRMDTTKPHDPSGRRKSRASLTEHQLLRHGNGSFDVRSQLVQVKTPAGFIPLTNPSPPVLGPPPTYNPAENPFFPPVALVSIKPPHGAPPYEPPPPPPQMWARPESDRSCWTSDSDRPQHLSSTSTLVSSPDGTDVALAQSADIRFNARSPVPRRDSSATLVHKHRSHELSLSELFVHDWVGMRVGSSSTSSAAIVARREASIPIPEEKARKKRERDGKKERKSRRSGDKDAYLSSSDSDWSKKPSAVDELDARLARVDLASREKRRDNWVGKVEGGEGGERATKKDRQGGVRASDKLKSWSKHLPEKLIEAVSTDYPLRSKPD